MCVGEGGVGECMWEREKERFIKKQTNPTLDFQVWDIEKINFVRLCFCFWKFDAYRFSELSSVTEKF